MTGELSPGQKRVLDALAASELRETFYLSGGTALAAFHLHHRTSEDLDLFAREPFDSKRVLSFVASIADEPPTMRRIHERLGFIAKVGDETLKLEFVHYEYDCVEPPALRYDAIKVDGLRDILANKLSAVVERTDPKDYADILLLLRRDGLSLEQGMADCHRKFGWPGLRYLLETAFLRVENLRAWPVLEPPVSLEEAKEFFRGLARELVKKDVEEDL